MKIEIGKSYKMELTEEEADWLRGYMANQTQEYEHQTDTEMRKRFFNALKEVMEQ